MASMSPAPTIHIVDDDDLFRLSASGQLRKAGYVVRNYPSAGNFLLAKFEEGPACILLDVRMPGPSGLDLQKAIAAWPLPLPIIFVSASSDVHTAVQAMKAGAVDFLTKPVDREVLLKAVENGLARGERDRIAREQVNHWRTCYETLTQREQDVFARVVAGKMNKQIANDLGAAERTIKAYRAQVMKKLHAASVADLVHIATQLQNDPRSPIRFSGNQHLGSKPNPRPETGRSPY